MTFFGTQPTLTQVPPSRPGSSSATRAPYSAARCAAASPPLPPPSTIRSNACTAHLRGDCAKNVRRKRTGVAGAALKFSARFRGFALEPDRFLS